MATVCEVYMQDELQEVVTDLEKNEEWKALIERAGLTGQAELLTVKEKSPIPFIPMNEEMMHVYRTLCPADMIVDKYNKSAIPIRALSAIALCKQERYFGEIMVWYDDKKWDPLVVGFKTDRYHSRDAFLIARWGDELRSFPELKALAVKRKLEEMKLKLESAIATVEQDAAKWMSAEYIPSISW